MASAFASVSFAVQAAEPATESVEEVVITGSRVRGAAPVGSAVTTIGPADIAASGQVTLDRAIKELPQNFDLGVSENSRGQSGGNGNIVYGNTVNLRGIGPYATLVMLDGHRVVNNSRSTDPSILPTLGVERVEVVADGASAIYGSDAIAGVVKAAPQAIAASAMWNRMERVELWNLGFMVLLRNGLQLSPAALHAFRRWDKA
jgi:iron complex outermembrane receptor protein